MTEKEAQDTLLGLSDLELLYKQLYDLITFALGSFAAGQAVEFAVDPKANGSRCYRVVVGNYYEGPSAIADLYRRSHVVDEWEP